MKPDNKLAGKLDGNDFIFTAEYLPITGTEIPDGEVLNKSFDGSITAVNVSDNHYGVAMSSLAASVALSRVGIEPVYQIVTRDRNRLAIQSDLLGAAYLGITNVMCLSGFHQTIIGEKESANVFDIDSIQLISLVKSMNNGQLLDGKNIQGKFDMLVGAAANPNLKPLELNILRLRKKIAAGADFIQTQAVFEPEIFIEWLETVRQQGLTEKVAIIAGVLPLKSAAQAQELTETHTDYVIPKDLIERLQAAGNTEDQAKEGQKITVEIINKLKGQSGIRGIHIFSGGDEAAVPEIINAVSR